SEEFMNMFMRISFGSAIKLVSFDESQWLPLIANSFVSQNQESERQHGRQPNWVHHPLDRNLEEYQESDGSN
ncbi:hypothetical protein Tco_1095584, partial [Tanacetum coccineum]